MPAWARHGRRLCSSEPYLNINIPPKPFIGLRGMIYLRVYFALMLTTVLYAEVAAETPQIALTL